MGPRTIRLVEVGTPEEERVVLAVGAQGVLPVAPDDGVEAAVAAVAQRQGVGLSAVPFEGDWRHPCPQQDKADMAVFAVGAPDASVLALASGLAGVAVRRPDDLNDPSDTITQVVVVFAPGDEPAQLRRTLARLSARGIPFALVPAAPAAAARQLVAKALLFPEIRIDDVHRLEDVVDGPARSGDGRSLLVMTGHGNSTDLGRDGMVVCGRGHGQPSAADATYPCFRDGLCFRQALSGRPASSREGLIDPALLGHPVALVLGCGTMPLGDAPFAVAGTILARLMEGGAVGGLATVGILFADSAVETALLSLLLEGNTMGRTAQAFNAWYRACHGHAAPTTEGYGPVVAFGNPGLRLRPRLASTAVLKWAVEAPAADWGLVIEAPAGVVAGAVRLSGADDGEGTIYALASPPSAELVRLAAFDRSGPLAEIAAIGASAATFAFWEHFLAEIGAVPDDAPRSLTRYLCLKPFEAEAQVVAPTLLAAHRAMVGVWLEWQRRMLDAAAQRVRRNGSFTFHVWREFYRHDGGRALSHPCPVCGGESAPLRYRSIRDALDEHWVVQCPACGILGEQPPWLDTILDHCAFDRETGTLSVGLVLRSRSDVEAHGVFQVARDCWDRRHPDVAPPLAVRLDPGGSGRVDVTVAASPDLAAGLHPITILGVTNGALSHLRFHLTVPPVTRSWIGV